MFNDQRRKKWQTNNKDKEENQKMIIKMIIEKKNQYLEIQAKSSTFKLLSYKT